MIALTQLSEQERTGMDRYFPGKSPEYVLERGRQYIEANKGRQVSAQWDAPLMPKADFAIGMFKKYVKGV